MRLLLLRSQLVRQVGGAALVLGGTRLLLMLLLAAIVSLLLVRLVGQLMVQRLLLLVLLSLALELDVVLAHELLTRRLRVLAGTRCSAVVQRRARTTGGARLVATGCRATGARLMAVADSHACQLRTFWAVEREAFHAQIKAFPPRAVRRFSRGVAQSGAGASKRRATTSSEVDIQRHSERNKSFVRFAIRDQ